MGHTKTNSNSRARGTLRLLDLGNSEHPCHLACAAVHKVMARWQCKTIFTALDRTRPCEQQVCTGSAHPPQAAYDAATAEFKAPFRVWFQGPSRCYHIPLVQHPGNNHLVTAPSAETQAQTKTQTQTRM